MNTRPKQDETQPTSYRLSATGSFQSLLSDPQQRGRVEARLEAVPSDKHLMRDK